MILDKGNKSTYTYPSKGDTMKKKKLGFNEDSISIVIQRDFTGGGMFVKNISVRTHYKRRDSVWSNITGYTFVYSKILLLEINK